METVEIVINNIRNIIDTKGLKHKAIAEKAGYSIQQFSNILNLRKTIECSDIWRISAALDVTPNELFGITDRKEHDYDTE